MTRRKIFSIMFLALLLVGLVVNVGYAQGQQPDFPSDDDVNAVAQELYCPVCENIPLDVCGTQACAQWRELIREKLQEGWTKEQIKQYFVDSYGDRVLAEPPKRGINWLAYLIPPILFIVGVFLLYNGFRSWKRKAAVVQSQGISVESMPEIDDEYVKRIEEELYKD